MRNFNMQVAVDKAENTTGTYTMAEAAKAVYSAGYDLNTRDDDYTYVFNKTTNEFEYLAKAETESLTADYEKMTVVTTIEELDSNIKAGGIIYLEGTFDAGASADKVLYVQNDTVIVGDNTSLLVPSNLQDTTSISQYDWAKMPLFVVEKEGVTLTLCDVNVTADDANNSFVAVIADKCTVNVFDCNLTGTAYGINVRNPSAYGTTYKIGDTINEDAQMDAICNVTIKNSKIIASLNAINWKFVGGECNVEDCILSQSTAGCALIANEGNGAKITLKNCSLNNGSTERVTTQYGAQNSTVTLTNCKYSGNENAVVNIANYDKATDGKAKWETNAGSGNKIIVDGTTVKSN